MREKTKGNLFRSVLSIALAIVLFLGIALVFAGCDEDDEFYDPENPSASPSFFERYVGGFNTVFANDSSGYGGIDEGEEGIDERSWATYAFRTQFFYGLSYFYAYRAQGLPDSLTELDNKFSTLHYDSNRALVYHDRERLVFDYTRHWNWSINPFFSPTLSTLYQLVFSPNLDYSTWLEEFVNYIDKGDIDISSYNFSFFYNILQVVLYEIMLGYTDLTTINVDIQYASTTPESENYLEAGSYTISIKNSNSSLLPSGHELTVTELTSENPQESMLYAYRLELQQQYENQTRYTGFTKDNADRFITYILDEVIGTDVVVEHDHDKFRDTINYRNYVEVVANIVYELTYDGSGDSWVYSYSQIPNYTVEFDITDESGNIKGQTDFAAKPATYVRYFPGETLFGEDDVDYQFSNKPIGEYQSILVVPARTITTLLEGGIRLEAGFVFNFMSYNKDLKINAKVRYQYYNEITGYRKLFEFDCDQINFDDGYEGVDPDGRTYWENDFELSIETDALPADVVTTEKDATGYEVSYYTIGFFNNDSLLNAVAGAEGGEVTLTEFGEIQDLYKVIASQNGYGGITVLNEKKINSSFFEIVLDVVKTPNDPPDTDYNFRLVLSNTLLTPGIY